MNRKKIVVPALIGLLCFAIILIYTFNYANQPTANATPDKTLDDNDDGNEPVFVIPENEFGTIGLISSLTAAFGIFAVTRKK